LVSFSAADLMRLAMLDYTLLAIALFMMYAMVPVLSAEILMQQIHFKYMVMKIGGEDKTLERSEQHTHAYEPALYQCWSGNNADWCRFCWDTYT